jgi:predicted nucleic acid-binding protein
MAPTARPLDAKWKLRALTVFLADGTVVSTATVGAPLLRALDALYLTTAATIATGLDSFVTYDKRLADAATGIGLSVAAIA